MLCVACPADVLTHDCRGTRSKGDALESMASEADLARMAALSAEIEELSERRVRVMTTVLPQEHSCLDLQPMMA
jgi:hypothetical protein